MALHTDIADLLVGRHCLACGAPGPALCGTCLRVMGACPVVRPDPVTVHGAAAYDGHVRDAIIALKERGERSLVGPLGTLLVTAVQRAVPSGPLTLVPVPAHRGTGRDSARLLAARAARALRRRGRNAGMVEALAPARAHAALKSLGREDRARAVAGTMRTTAALRRVTGAIVVVDDVCTTGATIGEAVRALGGTPVAAVVVAVTPAGRRTARQLG